MNSAGTQVQDQVDYDSFGKITNETQPSNGDRYGYTGREREPLVGLQYNRGRWYDPVTGRWTSQDPMGFGAGDANLYRYVGNDPTNETDPSGLTHLSYVSVTPPVLGKFGAFVWPIKWRVDNDRAIGAIMQRIDLDWNITGYPRDPNKGSFPVNPHYAQDLKRQKSWYEAWPVSDGKALNNDQIKGILGSPFAGKPDLVKIYNDDGIKTDYSKTMANDWFFMYSTQRDKNGKRQDILYETEGWFQITARATFYDKMSSSDLDDAHFKKKQRATGAGDPYSLPIIKGTEDALCEKGRLFDHFGRLESRTPKGLGRDRDHNMIERIFKVKWKTDGKTTFDKDTSTDIVLSYLGF
jgi:RHS repeat-associated protein